MSYIQNRISFYQKSNCIQQNLDINVYAKHMPIFNVAKFTCVFNDFGCGGNSLMFIYIQTNRDIYASQNIFTMTKFLNDELLRKRKCKSRNSKQNRIKERSYNKFCFLDFFQLQKSSINTNKYIHSLNIIYQNFFPVHRGYFKGFW